MTLPPLAWLSPLPPVRSGVSEYSADLVPELAGKCAIRLFAASPAGGAVAGIPVETPEAFDAAPELLAVYHMGNNPHHRFVAERAARRPGVLVLHDLVLHHYWIEETLARQDRRGYIELMAGTYGELGAGAGRARADEVASQTEYFVFPLFESLAAASRMVVTHNRRAARAVCERVEGVPVAVVPMGIPSVSSDPLPDREAARAELGIGRDELVVGSFGFLTPIKRHEVCLSAFARAARDLGAARFVAVGEASAAVDLPGLARRFGIEQRVHATGFLPYDEAKRWIAASDVFLNLRYPTAGETSASLLRLLGWGKPVVVSDYAQFREIPEDVVARVALGPSEEVELAALLTAFGRHPELGRALGESAARFVASEHSLERAAAAYLAAVREAAELPAVATGRLRPLREGRPSHRPRHPRVAIELEPLPGRVLPGTRLRLRARLRNTGDTTLMRWWNLSGGHAVLGLRLYEASGEPVEEFRLHALPRDLAPGDEARIDISFQVPRHDGRLVLLLDLLIERWGWLRHRGGEALLVPLDVCGRV